MTRGRKEGSLTPGQMAGGKKGRESGWERGEDVGGVESLIPRLPFTTGIGMAAVVGLSGMVENEDRSIGGREGEGNGPQQLDPENKRSKGITREKKSRRDRWKKWLNGPKLTGEGKRKCRQFSCAGHFQRQKKRQRTGSVWPRTWPNL